MIGTVPTYHERRHAERITILDQLKREEARDQLDREIRSLRAQLRRLCRIRDEVLR